MKKILIVLLMICVFTLSLGSYQSVSFADVQYLTINTSFSYVYKEANHNEHYSFKINNGEKVVLLGEEGDFYKISYTFEDREYVGFIPFENASNFVEDQEETPVYNGKIIIDTEVYNLDGSLMENISLKVGHEIYIYEGFDSESEFTKIKFSYNNRILVGQVKTINLSPNGVNKAVIIAFSIITAIVGIILILLGFKKKKWHKRLKTEKK